MRQPKGWVGAIVIATVAAHHHAVAVPRVTAPCFGYSTTQSEGDVGRTTENRTVDPSEHGFHFGTPSRREFRQFLQRYSPYIVAKKCENWPRCDSRVGMLLPIPGSAVLLVGESYNPERGGNETGVQKLKRIYHVESFSKAGDPLEGQISIKLQRDLMQAERACLENLRDMPIAWAGNLEGSLGKEETVELQVREVEFSRVARLGSGGQAEPTGEILAAIKLKEKWIDMAYRKLKEQVWGIGGGIAGSAVLMVTTSLVGRVRRHRRGV